MSTPCFGLHAIFESTHPDKHEQAKAKCEDCPFFAPCAAMRDSAISENLIIEGTWAGVGYGIRKPKAIAECGTEAGLSRHRRFNERICVDCKTFANAKRARLKREAKERARAA